MSKLSSLKKGMIYALATLLVIPTWLAIDMGGAEKVKAADPLIIENQGFKVSVNSGAYSDVATYQGKYVVGVDGVHASTYDLMFDSASRASENLRNQAFELYLDTGAASYNGPELISYYNAHYSSSPAVLSYLLGAATGANPFAYIKGDGTQAVKLIDGYMYSAYGLENDMRIPGDYPINSYKVNGSLISDTNQYGLVSFTLQLDKTDPVVNVTAPIVAEEVSGGTNYTIEWTATDAESGIKVNSVGIKYYDGSNWDWIPGAQNLANSGSYVWNVPLLKIANAKVRVIVLNNVDMKSKDASPAFKIGDFTAPVITLIGDAEVTLEVGETFTDPGATAIDNYDGNMSGAITVGGAAVDESTPGDYVITYNVDDNAGNPAVEVIRTVHVIDHLPAPENLIVSNNDKTLNISWDKVTDANYYYLSIGRTSSTGYVTTVELTENNYQTTVSSYGDYKVRVIASRNQLTETELDSQYFAKRDISVSETQVVVTVVQAVSTTTIVAPETVSEVSEVEDVEDTGDQDEALDEDGKIKGEENEDATEDSDINWTPWIILFILIILAGAATGGYFYWFADDEEVETKVRENKKPAKNPAPKKSDKSKGSGKRRW